MHTGADNPRHKVWVNDEGGIRQVISATLGEESISVGGRTYVHTREIDTGQWVYTPEAR